MIKKKNIRGQAALILILLSAAALIFLAITLNWGRIAQTKALISIAADEGASLLASDGASYGEMEKQTYLNDTNQITESTGVLLAILLVVIAIIVTIFTIWWNPAATAFTWALVAASLVMAVVNLVLQVVVIQPGITSLWNSLQKNQPVQQQFFEGGIAAALQSSVGDQVNITDYDDWNANGVFGTTSSGFPKDSVSRFAVYYTDRLKMLNQPPIPAVVYFYDALGELMNGETCDQNANDVSIFGASPNPACASLNCANDPIDPACQVKIPNGFQLNDACTGSNPGNTATYSPYCDPCCQPLTVNGKAVRPSTCTDQTQTPSQCLINNPYGAPYYFLYDPSFQNYAAGQSFLDQFGRDQQMGPFTASLTPQGSATNGIFFPNGIYPFFWLMNEYSPEVDNINPSSPLQTSQVHWCAAGGSIPSSGAAPTGFADLAQLSLPYSCSGQDCCVNYLGSSSNGVIDMVGSPSFGSNPGTNSNFGEGGTGSWLPGDNQMCLAAWSYNGSSSTGLPDGTCEWTGSASVPPPSASPSPNGPMTVDGLDDTMHTLSDFVDFADTLLNNDVGTLSSTFSTWYPQAKDWIDPSTGRLPPLVNSLNTWSSVITNWLKSNYTSSGAWCVPSETTLLNGNSSTAEDTYIKSNSATTTWGDLPHVIACLNYNASTPINSYQSCLNALPSGSCPSSLPAQCAASVLGRSLAGAAPAYDGCAGQYAAWVQHSLTLATDEAPKFALRSLYLQDVYTRAETMQSIFPPAAAAIQSFLSGPAAQLSTASQSPPASALPNSVIYGWVDNTYSNGHPGYAHIVKVTAYSAGRNVNQSTGQGYVADSILPWIQTSCTSSFLGLCTSRSYTLVDRDESVYVSVKRWDEDHGNSILFPNGHPLWQFMFHNPQGGTLTTGQGLMQACNGVTLSNGGSIGFGLLPATAAGLGFSNISSIDQTALANAFMLNDEGNGKVDPYAKSSAAYSSCLSAANTLLSNAPESHICAQYIASRNASGPSGNGDSDYSLKFYSCSEQPEDLAYTTGGS